MINIEFLVVAYFVGLFVDWVFQLQWQAENKSKWDRNDDKIISLIAVTTHSMIYAILTTSVTLRIISDFSNSTFIVIVLFISHMIIDTRIPVKAIMRFKGMTDEQINDYQNYSFMHIGIDHRLHEMVLLILAIFV